MVSSIGLGTAVSRGGVDRVAQRDAIIASARGGVNLIDSSANYGFGDSEVAIGDAFVELKNCGISRDELVISTKGGYIPSNTPQEYFANQIVSCGLASLEDLTAGCHCISPGFLHHQINQSLQRLNTSYIDIYFLHNPEEEAAKFEKAQFIVAVRRAIEAFEEAVSLGKIRMYGISTWDGLRSDSERNGGISLSSLVGLARDVAGSHHHFRVVQAPLNAGMTELVAIPNQPGSRGLTTCMEIASDLNLAVITSAPLMQGRLARRLPAWVRNASMKGTIAQRAIQFARSVPGVTSTLVGMKRTAHVDENLQLVSEETLPSYQVKAILGHLGT
jgi:aryl-alcohol dehydrogenase-like predicted oxidoreductase